MDMRLILYLAAFALLTTRQGGAREIEGELAFPGEWTVFAPFEPTDPPLPAETLKTVPAQIVAGERTIEARRVAPTGNQFDFAPLLGGQAAALNRVAWVFVPLASEKDQAVTLGLGGDYLVEAWLNGERIFEPPERNQNWPPSINDFRVGAQLRRGDNVLAVRFTAGRASAVLALGGPAELLAGDFQTILPDPFFNEGWAQGYAPARPGGKPPAEIGARRELFVDDFLVDGLSGGVSRRLHHPTPREVVLTFDKPWEGKASAYFSVVEADGRILLYYNTRPSYPGGGSQTACVAESADGVNFSRPDLGLYESIAAPGGRRDPNFDPSKENNMVWRLGASGHNFTPFLDANPAAPPDQRFKAVAYHPNGGGLGAYASPDGINWEMLTPERIISEGGFDSQNLAFWDGERKLYACYYRREDPRGRVRGIWRSVSDDFIHWREAQPVTYEDDRMEHMYTNVIRPYFRAPHICIGTPARFVPGRTKVPEHPVAGISDAVLMSSRDGLRFQRWEEAFIRPGPEPEVWTDRNNYPAWGLVQTGPAELSLYWTEHYRHPGMRLRRGTIRLDGFASLHAGAAPGEMLTRPLIFTGRRLEVNYATSAVGSLRFELCDPEGNPLSGFALADSEVLFGNEIEHAVTWKRDHNLAALAGRPVRLRVRLHDADLYSLRFAP